MKIRHWTGAIATGWVMTIAGAGCSGDDFPPATGTAGAGTAGAGTAGAGTAGAGGGATEVERVPPIVGSAAHTILTGDSAAPGAAAPAKYASTCGPCHGGVGQGVMLIGPEIRHTPTDYSTYAVRNGRLDPVAMKPTLMGKYPETGLPATSVSAAELTEIQTWLAGLPKPTTGVALYQDFCGNCHGPMNGSGGATGVKIVSKLKSLVSQKVRMGVGTDPALRTRFMPPFSAAALTDAELGLISEFLMSK